MTTKMRGKIHRGCVLLAALGAAVWAEGAEVRLTGPLGARLDLMIRNHVCATDVATIVAPFREKTERRGWWQTEFWGKYMHAAVPFWCYTRDPALKAKIDAGVEAILASQEPCGYIGNYPEDIRCGEGWDVWGMKYTLMGLMHYYDGFREAPAKEDRDRAARALAGARRLCDYVIAELGPNGRRGVALWQTGNWCGYASSSILEPVVWLWRRTGDRKYLDFAAYVVEGIEKPEAGPRLVDLALKAVPVADRNGYGNVAEKGGSYVMKRNRWKAYEMMSCYQGLLDFAEEIEKKKVGGGGEKKVGGGGEKKVGGGGEKKVGGGGESRAERYVAAAVKAGESILRDEINVAGGCTSSEAWYHGAKKQHFQYGRQQETCVLTTWLRLCERLLAATGESRWADALEHTFYNAYLASMNRDGSEFAAYTPLDGARGSGHHHCFMHTNCCNANGPRGFLAFLRALLTAKDDVATMNFYCSGNARTVLPASKREVAFETYALYPKNGYVRLTNHTTAPGAFALALRIPAWSAKTRVRVNGAAVEGPVEPGRYFTLKRDWKVGDVVEIDFDMAVKAHVLDQCVAFTRGPVALARDTRFGDGPIDAPWWCADLSKIPPFLSVRSPDADVWMAFSASVPAGWHRENPDGALGRAVRFCDYASAANLWKPDNACRVWFPLTRWP